MLKFKNKYTQASWSELTYIVDNLDKVNNANKDCEITMSKIAFVSDEGFYKKQWQDNYLLLLATMPPEIRKILENSSVNIGPILEETA